MNRHEWGCKFCSLLLWFDVEQSWLHACVIILDFSYFQKIWKYLTLGNFKFDWMSYNFLQSRKNVADYIYIQRFVRIQQNMNSRPRNFSGMWPSFGLPIINLRYFVNYYHASKRWAVYKPHVLTTTQLFFHQIFLFRCRIILIEWGRSSRVGITGQDVARQLK